jgi:hypothetical protein
LDAKVDRRTEITTDNTEGLAIEANDIGYFGNLQLGTPGTNFKILFDTGSADFWVPSQQCNDDGDCGGHQTLGTKSSQSFVASNKGFQVTYGPSLYSVRYRAFSLKIPSLCLMAPSRCPTTPLASTPMKQTTLRIPVLRLMA